MALNGQREGGGVRFATGAEEASPPVDPREVYSQATGCIGNNRLGLVSKHHRIRERTKSNCRKCDHRVETKHSRSHGWRKMSASLLRKGLELLEASTASTSWPKRPATTQPKKQLLIRKKKKIVSRHKRDKATVKGKVTKSVLEEYQKLKTTDHFQENLQYMMSSHFVTDSAITQKVLAQNRGRKATDRPEEEAKKKKPEGTVFTDEDFQKFEKEYFAGALSPN